MSTLNVMLAKKEKLEQDLKLVEKTVRGRRESSSHTVSLSLCKSIDVCICVCVCVCVS